MKSDRLPPAVDFSDLGFGVSATPANRMPHPHRHNEIEMTVLEQGWIEYLFGGGRVQIPAGTLCVRWAAIPHQSTDFEADCLHYSLKIPLAWFLNWRLPERLVTALLGGELLLDHEPDAGCSDLAMLRRWHASFQAGTPEHQRMVLLEAEARLLRLAMNLPSRSRQAELGGVQAHVGKVERMTVFVAGHYTEDIAVADIAQAAGLHPNSAMRLFRKACGMTLMEYLTMHRVCHAQQLLATTDIKIRNVAIDCGFGSVSRFYAAFERIVGQRPREYRTSIRSQLLP